MSREPSLACEMHENPLYWAEKYLKLEALARAVVDESCLTGTTDAMDELEAALEENNDD